MAQKVHIVLEDDIDQSEAQETVAFGLDGKDYLIDLSSQHAGELRDALALYVGHARAGGSKRSARKSATRTSSSDAGAIRDWAKGQGYEVSERGRISSEVREAYTAAH